MYHTLEEVMSGQNPVGLEFVLERLSGSVQAVVTNGNIGSASFLDWSFITVKTILVENPPTPTVSLGSTGIVLDTSSSPVSPRQWPTPQEGRSSTRARFPIDH
jgi:hypothetical protein